MNILKYFWFLSNNLASPLAYKNMGSNVMGQKSSLDWDQNFSPSALLTFWAHEFSVLGAARCIVGRLTASPASTY